MKFRKYGRRSRFEPKPDAIYRKCPRCGGKYNEEQMRTIKGELICGRCFLLQLAEMERRIG